MRHVGMYWGFVAFYSEPNMDKKKVTPVSRLVQRPSGTAFHTYIQKIARESRVSLSRRALFVLGDVAHHFASRIGATAHKMSSSGRVLRRKNGKIGLRLLNVKSVEAAVMIVMQSGTSLAKEAVTGGRRAITKHMHASAAAIPDKTETV